MKLHHYPILPGGLTYVATSSGSSGSEQFVTVSGGGQQISVGGNYSPVVLQLVSGTGTPITSAAVQVSQAAFGWQAPCSGQGRCASPPPLATGSTTLTTNSNGEVSITVLSVANTAESTTIVATAGTAAMTQLTVSQHP